MQEKNASFVFYFTYTKNNYLLNLLNMDIRKVIGLVIIAFVLMLIAIGISALGEGTIDPPNDIPEGTVEAFTIETRNKVIAELGQPIEGFEPFMFLRVYPGLLESDFDGVDALIGAYRFENDEIVYDLQGEQEVHSAARAIPDEGMVTLLSNIAERLNIDLTEDRAVEEVIRGIEAGERHIEEETITVAGEVTCLPHKDREGPQTLECALGLLADDGNHYGLTTPGRTLPNELTEDGNRVLITGINMPPQPQNIYDVVGIIEVKTVEEL
jgi:hypothetical protein